MCTCLLMTVGIERVTSEIPVRVEDGTDDGAALSSPNSAVSSFQMDFCVRNSRKSCDGASDDDESGSTRKKLRLSKEQSAFLEHSFKEHTTLNPVTLAFFFFSLIIINLRILFSVFFFISYFIFIYNKKSAETKACPCKTVKSPSPSSGSLVSEQKGKVRVYHYQSSLCIS